MTATTIDGAALLKQAIGYTLAAVEAVPPGPLAQPTPCRDWDLRMLLCHLNDSLAALHEGIATRTVGPHPDTGPRADPAAVFTGRARLLLGACAGAGPGERISIGGCALSGAVVAAAGALEVAVHGWDVAQASGRRVPIPAALAADLLELCPALVTDRRGLFAAAVPVAPGTGPGDRLVAFLGRDPQGRA